VRKRKHTFSTSMDHDSAVARRAASLQRLEKLAKLLDSALPIPATRFRIGLDGLLGFIPGIGDAAGAAMSAYMIFEAARLGLPVATLLRMAGNVAIETVIGAVPIVGDLFDIGWKANLKNFALVRGHVANASLPGRSLNQVGRLLLVPVMLTVLFLLLISIAVVALVFRFVFG
jgi:hypothetical protein